MKPKHIKRAEEFLDMDEVKHMDELNKYFRMYTSWPYNVKTTPWCAAFVNAIVGEAGFGVTKSFMARSFLRWGKKVTTPRMGDVVVFSRGRPPSGHVAFYMRNYDRNHIVVLGGNQGDEVCLKVYKKSRILGYRRPKCK